MTQLREFSTRQLLNVLHTAGLDLDHARLRQWHKRDVLPGGSVGKGTERKYSLDDLIFIASLVFVLRRVERIEQATGLAKCFAQAVRAVYDTGPDGDVALKAPIYAIVERFGMATFEPIDAETVRNGIQRNPLRIAAEMYATETAAIAQAGFFAIALSGAIEHVSDPRALLIPLDGPEQETSR